MKKSPKSAAAAGKVEKRISNRMSRLEADYARAQQEILEMKSAAQHLLQRYVDLEAQAASLTSLYVSCHRLHTCMDRIEVLAAIQEIIVNLIGCEQYALFKMSDDRRELILLDSIGIDPDGYRHIASGKGVIGKYVQTGEIFRVGKDGRGVPSGEDKDLKACVPLKLRNEVTGAIALFRLLPHKPALVEFDQELFEVLRVHAAPALAFAESSNLTDPAREQV